MARKKRVINRAQVEDPNQFERLSTEEEESTIYPSTTNNKEESSDRSSSSIHDNPRAILVSITLTNNNYFTWKHAMVRALTMKKKLKFIDPDEPIPEKNSEAYQIWREGDCLVTAWILNSIHKDFADSFVFAPSSKSLWKDLEQRFGDNNLPMLFRIKRQISRTIQGNQSVCAYFSSLKKLWDEM